MKSDARCQSVNTADIADNKIQFSCWIMITIKGHKSSENENLGNSSHTIQSAFYMIHPAASDFCVNQSLIILQMMSSSKLCKGT